MADQFTFDIPTFDFSTPAAPTTTPVVTDSTFSFDIPTFDTPATAAPTFDFNISADLSVPATPAPAAPSFDFSFNVDSSAAATPAPTIPSFDIPEIAIPVEQKNAAPITFEMPEMLTPSSSQPSNDWSVPISFAVPDMSTEPAPSTAPITFDIPTIPVAEPQRAVDLGSGLPSFGGSQSGGLPPLGGGLPGLPPLGGGLPGLPPLGASAGLAGLPPMGMGSQSPVIAPLQGGALSGMRGGAPGLPTLVSLGTPGGSLPKLAPKASPVVAKAAPPPAESAFITDPSSFYLQKSWKVEGVPDPVKAALNYDIKGSGAKLSLKITLADGSSSSYDVNADVTIHNLVLAVADKNKIWRHEIFSLLYGQYKWLNHAKTFAEEGVKNGDTLSFRIKYWKNQFKLQDNAVRHLMYLQVKDEIISGRWPCATPSAIRLAGHQLQIEVGNFSPSAHKPGFLKPKINQYLPPSLLKEDLDYVERRILYVHSRISCDSKEDAEDIYVSIAQGLQLYGTSIFPAKKGEGANIGVAEDGVFVPAESNPKMYQFIMFPFLKGWKGTDDGFQIEVSKPSEATHKFVAGKDATDAVFHLLACYYQMLESIDKGNMPRIVLPAKGHSIPPYTLLTPPRENLSRGTPVDIDAKITNRLIILRNAYRKVCEQAKVKPLDSMIWQIDRALDEEIALDKLDLSFLGIGPAELGALATTLEAVFSYTPPPERAAYFSENLAVTQFILNDNPIGLAGALALGRIIKVANFKEYYLKRVGLGEKGAQALKPFLEANSTLEKIDLEGNEIKNRGVSAVVKSLKSNTKTNCFIFSNNKCNEQVTLVLSNMLAANNYIQELAISGNKIGDGGVGALLTGMQRNSGLKNFDLSNTKFTSKTGPKLIQWLESRHQMRSLIMADNKLDEATGKAISKFLQSPSGLMTLDISRTKIGAKSITDICQAIGSNKSLRHLFINGNEFDKKGSGSIIVESLRSNDTLQKLGLGYCALGKSLVVSLAAVFKASSKLRYLDMSGTPDFKDPEVIRAWKDTLASPGCILEEFICTDSQITVDGIKELSDALVTNKYMKKIDFSKNKLGKPGLMHIANMLVSNKNITEVTLKATEINPVVAAEFVSALDGKNRTLKTVYVGDNGKNTLQEWQALLSNANVHFQFQF